LEVSAERHTMDKNKKKSALHLSEGTEKVPSFNPKNLERFKRKKRTAEEFIEGILSGNRLLLSQAITLVESTKLTHQEKAEAIIEGCIPKSGNSIRIGITGSPGVGKSTFIEAFGKLLIQAGKKIAVLAIDPSSQLTHGSILGDKTRMQELSVHPQAFVRPSPAGDSLGGVARATRESILLCEAAGFDVIIVETVGVGQSEIAVHSMVDFFLLLLLPNAGDELQGIKRGVVEMADLIAVNKSDGPNLDQAKLAKRQYRNALHLFPPKAGGWIAKAELCAGQTGMNLDLIWQTILRYQKEMQENQYWQQKRAQQAQYWMQETIQQQLKQLFQNHPEVQKQLPTIEEKVLNGELSSFKAAKLLLNLFRG
jgi:LAO/AO transport system kinase